MQLAKQAAAILIACALIATLAAPSALAQERAPRVGVVDMSKVLDGYKEFQASDQQYKAFLRERQVQLAERASLRLLNPQELKEYQNLKQVTAPSDEQKRRIEELKAVADTREKELTGLQAVTTPTEEQQKRLAELNDLQEKSNAELAQMEESARAEINQRNKELSDQLNKKIEAVLAAVAKDKRFDLVLAKDAVLYGGLDITDAVLAKLNAPPTGKVAEQLRNPDSLQGWQKVASWSGEAMKSTDAFTVGTPWKIWWNTEPGESGPGNFVISIYNQAGELVGIVANVIGQNTDESVQHKSGTYHLEIDATQRYAVSVWTKSP